MRDVYAQIATALRNRVPCAVATLVATRHAAPAPIGTSVLVVADGSFVGNIGAGCHEAELIESARAALLDGLPRVVDFDLADDLLDGSSCGASMEVAIWVPDADFVDVADRIVAGDEAVEFSCGARGIRIEPKRKVIIVGATDLAAQLTNFAAAGDFMVTVVDPRPAFATCERHPNAANTIVAWPADALPSLLSGASAIVVVAHDAKIDVPALQCALTSDVAYIGLLGSRRSQAARAASLRELGFGHADLDRIHGPAGLDLGATTGAQVACSILAELLSVLNNRSALPLRTNKGPIHDQPMAIK